jgi:hypothetical protein
MSAVENQRRLVSRRLRLSSQDVALMLRMDDMNAGLLRREPLHVTVHTVDVATWLGAIAILGAVAFGSAWIPACRAAAIDPIQPLRHE